MSVTREKLLAFVARAQYRPAKMKELARLLGVPQAEYRDFRRLVKDVVAEGLLVRGHHNRYEPPTALNQVVGRLKVHARGFGLVARSGGESDIFIPVADIREALDGDLVRVALTTAVSQRGEPLGRIVDIVEKMAGEIVGTYRMRGRRVVVEPDGSGVNRDIYLDEVPVAIAEGYKVVVRIVARDRGYDGLRGKIVEVLGDPEDPKLDFLTLVRRFDLKAEFASEVEAEAAKATIDLDVSRREDLRSLSCFTIDPDAARDFDDAVSLEPNEDGGCTLGVHIADVSHYVRRGSALDGAARERGTSVYLLDRVIHMLPERLAAEICSLAPGTDRPAVSVFMRLNAAGQLGDYRIVESVIHSAARLTYGQVQSLFDGRDEAAGPAVDLAAELAAMRDLAAKRTALRLDRGALDFALDQPRVEIDAASRPVALGRYPRWESHRLVEEFMLLANECVADYVLRRDLPVLYRVHRPPSPSSMVELGTLVSSMRIDLGPGDVVKPRDLQLFLAGIAGRKDEAMINKMVLRAMSRAEYAPESAIHFGLACQPYLHFTSPIRRYPDLRVHRVLKDHLAGNEHAADVGEEGLEALGRWASARERRAEEVERIYVRTKQMRYMERHIGERFAGVVTGVLRGGFFVEVGDFMVDGFCLLRTLDDFYELDERRHRLVGRRGRRVFEMGTEVEVVIAAVDWVTREMDLALVEEVPRQTRGKRRKKKR